MKELTKSIVNGIKGTNRIPDDDADDGSGVNTSSDKAKAKESVKVWWKKLINSMTHDLVDHPEMCFGYPVDGEDEIKPLPARWAEYRDAWIGMVESKYGEQTACNWDKFMSKVKDDARINSIIKSATIKL